MDAMMRVLAGNVTGQLAAVAMVLVAALSVVATYIRQRSRLLRAAVAKKEDTKLRDLLAGSGVSLEGTSAIGRLRLAERTLESRERRFAFVVILIAFFATLGTGLGLVALLSRDAAAAQQRPEPTPVVTPEAEEEAEEPPPVEPRVLEYCCPDDPLRAPTCMRIQHPVSPTCTGTLEYSSQPPGDLASCTARSRADSAWELRANFRGLTVTAIVGAATQPAVELTVGNPDAGGLHCFAEQRL